MLNSTRQRRPSVYPAVGIEQIERIKVLQQERFSALFGRCSSRYLLFFLALFVVVLIPFALSSPLPLADYANHVARMHILAHLDDSPFLSKYYAVQWAMIPNLAMDIVAPPLCRIMPCEWAGMIFVAVTFFLLASAPILINWTLFGKRSILPFASFLVLYNRTFLWGFLNYLFTLGLALWVFLAYIRLRSKPVGVRLAIFAVLSMVLFVFHLHAFACYAIICFGFEAAAAWQDRRERRPFSWNGFAVAIGQTVIPAIVFVAFSTTKSKAEEISWGAPFEKVVGLVELFNNYNVALDVATLGALGLLLGLGFLTRRLRIHPLMTIPVLLLISTYVVMPKLVFGALGADRRLLLPIVLVGLAGLEWRVESERLKAAFVAFCLVLFGVRMVVVGINWKEADKIYSGIMKAIDMIEPGSRLAYVVGDDFIPYLRNPPLDNVGCMGVVRKDAFMNSMFAIPEHQILRVTYNTDTKFFRAASNQYRRETTSELLDPFADLPWDRFDYLLLLNPQMFKDGYKRHTASLYQAPHVGLYRIVRTEPAKAGSIPAPAPPPS